MQTAQLRLSFTIAVFLSLIFLTIWESYWRTQSDYYYAGLDDDRYLWSEHRAKVETATSEDIVIIGSSRTAFNFNTNVWTEVQGIRPINLSTDGKPAGPFLEDIVENTNFNGTIIMGVTPLLFFSPPGDNFWQNAKQWPDHYQNETYAQKLGQFLSKPFQRNLVMLTATELDFTNDLDLKSLIKAIPLKNRIEDNFVLPKFGYGDEHRNLFMYPIMKTDTAFAGEVQKAWKSFLPTLPGYEAVADGMPDIIDYHKKLIEKFKARGGKIIAIRHKSEHEWSKYVLPFLPRDKVWDKLIEASNIPAYHYLDHPFMQRHTLPDWSHMAADDAIIYTRDMVNQLILDGHLTQYPAK